MIDKILDFLLISSKDPKEWSASFKFALLGLVPVVLHAVSVACNFGLYCIGVDAASLNELVNVLSMIVFYSLSLISAIGFLVTFSQKLIRTAEGKNKALK